MVPSLSAATRRPRANALSVTNFVGRILLLIPRTMPRLTAKAVSTSIVRAISAGDAMNIIWVLTIAWTTAHGSSHTQFSDHRTLEACKAVGHSETWVIQKQVPVKKIGYKCSPAVDL